MSEATVRLNWTHAHCRIGGGCEGSAYRCSLLAETGNDVKVVQGLMRHAKLSTTIEVYTQAGMPRSGLRSGRPSMCSLTAVQTDKGRLQRGLLIAPILLLCSPLCSRIALANLLK
jgi:hypothetical protein